MPKRKYAFERNGEKQLEISWGGFWKNTEVRVGGNLLGTIPTQKELLAGKVFQLPDGSSLKVHLAKTWLSNDLQVLRNDKPLPGSSSDPATRLLQAYSAIYFIAGLNIVLGLLALIFRTEFLETLGFGIVSIVVGVVFLVLGFFTQRGSLVALIIALALYALDSLLVLTAGFSTGIFLRIALIAVMSQGIGAIKDMKKDALQPVS